MLVSANVDLEQPTESYEELDRGSTPLHLAAERGSYYL